MNSWNHDWTGTIAEVRSALEGSVQRSRLWKISLAVGLLTAGAAVVLGLLFREPSAARYRRLVDQGITLMANRQPKAAVPILEEATQTIPENPMGHYQLAWAYFLTSDPEATIKAVNNVLEGPEHRGFASASPRIADFYSLRAEAAFSLGQYEQARADFERVLELRPGDGLTHMMHSKTLRALSQPVRARDAAMRAIEAGTRTAESLALWGMLEKELGDLESARQRLQQAIDRSPGYTLAYHHLAQTLSRLGRREEALRMGELSKKLAAADDEVAKFNNRVGIQSFTRARYQGYLEAYARYCLRYRKDLHLAEAMNKLLLIDSEKGEYHLYRGIAAARLGQDMVAATYLRRAAELLPKLAAPRSELALLLVGAEDPQVSNPQEAVEWAQQAYQLGAGPDALAVALDAVGEASQAAEFVSWTFRPGEAWQVYRHREIDGFQGELLENPVEPLLLDVDTTR